MKVVFRNTDSPSEAERQQMYAIYQQSYTCTWEEFLEKKDTLDLYAVYYDGNQLIGFTGLCYKKIEVDGKNYMAVYVGQTVIPSSYRGKNLIQRTVLKLFFKHLYSHPFSTLVVWNNALTYRPYLILAKGAKVFYPNSANEQYLHYKNIQNKIGEIYYPKHYNASTGVVDKGYNVMKAHEVNYTAQETADPDVRYYLSRNPGSFQGHGLITFGFGTWENIFFYFKKRFIGKRSVKQ